MPRQVVNVDVEMADSGKDVDSGHTEDGHDVKILRAILDQHHAMGKRQRSGGSTISCAGGSVPTGMNGVAPRTSFALCAKALAVSAVAATMVASVLANEFMLRFLLGSNCK
jgi:hypothetical protein